jgi:hypothetical protein
MGRSDARGTEFHSVTHRNADALGGWHSVRGTLQTSRTWSAAAWGENRERFERELHRLRCLQVQAAAGVGSQAEILAGPVSTRTSIGDRVRVRGAVRSPGRVCADSQGRRARLVERWAFYFAREVVQAVNDLWRATKADAVSVSPES